MLQKDADHNTDAPAERCTPAMISTLSGRRVIDKSGRVLGIVLDSIIDCRDGRLTHLIVGSSRTTFYLPWRAIRVDTIGDGAPELVFRHRPRSRRTSPTHSP